MKRVLLASLFVLATTAFAQHSNQKPPIYDEKADAPKQIEKALAQAKKDSKNVLLQFGANWCGWCHLLHELCDSNKEISGVLKKNYVVVLVDVNQNHNSATNEKYGNPIRFGLPVIVVLDSNGKQLTTQDTGKLEDGDHHDPAKVLAFLKQWVPKR